MRIGSLVPVALLAMVLGFSVSAETEPTLDSVDETGSTEVAPEWAEGEDTSADWGSLAEDSASDWVEDHDESGEFGEAAEADSANEDSDADAWSDPPEVEETAALEPDADESGGTVAWGDFDDPDFEPGDSQPESSDPAMAEEVVADDSPEMESETAAASTIEIAGPTLVVNGVTLGPVGVDSEGRVGRVHTVATGDTLWDVSNAYLGTAWVWPSVWKDNREIQNPHLIEPGDKLWISSTEIRPISDAEADTFLAGSETLDDESLEKEYTEVAMDLPDDLDPDLEAVDEFPASDDEFVQLAANDEFEIAGMDQLPVGMPDEGEQGSGTGRTVRVSMRENMGFVSDVQLQASCATLFQHD